MYLMRIFTATITLLATTGINGMESTTPAQAAQSTTPAPAITPIQDTSTQKPIDNPPIHLTEAVKKLIAGSARTQHTYMD